MMVALHLLDGSSGEDRGEERCQHVLDIVETYGRMSATKGKGGGDATDDNQDDDDGDGEDVDGKGLVYTLLLSHPVTLVLPLAAHFFLALCF